MKRNELIGLLQQLLGDLDDVRELDTVSFEEDTAESDDVWDESLNYQLTDVVADAANLDASIRAVLDELE